MTEAPEDRRIPSAFVARASWIVFSFALFLRLIGIGWGLPDDLHHFSYHPDETVNVLVAQQIEPAKFDFDPDFYNYGTVYLTVLSVGSSLAGALMGSGTEDPTAVYGFLGKSILMGRLASSLAGAGSVVVVFLLLRRWVRIRFAFAGALLLAVAPAHVVHSRFATVDIVAALFVALCLHFSLKLLRAPSEPERDEVFNRKQVLLAALFAGLAAGTKYNAGLVVLAILAAIWLVKPKRPAMLTAQVIGVAAVAFALSTPGVFTNSEAFWRDFSYELSHSREGHGLVFVGRGPGFLYHLLNLAVGFGLIASLFGAVGLVTPRPEYRRVAWIVLAFAAPYYVLMGGSNVMFLRYTFPLMAVLSVGAGLLLDRWKDAPRANAAAVAIWFLAFAGIDGTGLMQAARTSVWMNGPDPRDTTARLLIENMKKEPGTTVGLASDPWYYTPPLEPSVGMPRPAFLRSGAEYVAGLAQQGIFRYAPADFSQRIDFDDRLLSEMNPTYVVFSSFEASDLDRLSRQRELPEKFRGQVEQYRRFMDQLKEGYEPFVAVGGGVPQVHDLEYIRPTIWVWKRK